METGIEKSEGEGEGYGQGEGEKAGRGKRGGMEREKNRDTTTERERERERARVREKRERERGEREEEREINVGTWKAGGWEREGERERKSGKEAKLGVEREGGRGEGGRGRGKGKAKRGHPFRDAASNVVERSFCYRFPNSARSCLGPWFCSCLPSCGQFSVSSAQAAQSAANPATEDLQVFGQRAAPSLRNFRGPHCQRRSGVSHCATLKQGVSRRATPESLQGVSLCATPAPWAQKLQTGLAKMKTRT